MIQFALIVTILSLTLAENDEFKGCYKTRYSPQTYHVLDNVSVDECQNVCKSKFYRYSLIHDEGSCFCDNFLGEEVNITTPCRDVCPNCELKKNLTDVYFTGNLVPGPPMNVQLTNLTDKSVHISWEKPKSYTEISGYLIKAAVIHTYANFILNDPEWGYSNDTFRTKIILWPATKYNITLRALSSEGPGAVFSKVIETEVGEPENLPENPKIIKHQGKTIEIKIMETSNSNGPVTSYLVIVVNDNHQQIFDETSLTSYDEAKKKELTYYITAELNPEDIHKNFIVGDGRYYKGYYNAPLESNMVYNVMVGIVSSLNGKTKRAFSTLDDSLVEDGNTKYIEDVIEDSPVVIVGLSVAIGLLTFLLIAGIIGFIILKSRVTTRRHRLSDNQELTLQGPMIEVENNGYIPEEENKKTNHYRTLKEKLRTIPSNQLKVEPTNLLGIGRFGRVNSGTIYENNTVIPVAAYTIFDKKLSSEDKKDMLKDLDVLIRTDKHENVIGLIGTCETPQMVVVILEYISMNLKDLLLSSRDSLPGKFCNMSEDQALEISVNIAKGMAHLESIKIVHKQLCARNIMITNGFVPKISGFGLAQYYSHNNLQDYTRWTALEVFKGQPHNPKSDVWSFACLLWEICTLGGTPYGNISNNDIRDQIIKGLRLPQLQYFSDELYQTMLSCWQIDMDERPNFISLIESINTLKENSLFPCLSFNLYFNFQYEEFYPDMEIAVRPVF